MPKIISQNFVLNKNFPKRQTSKKKPLSKYTKKILIKSLFIIFLSIIFICIQFIKKYLSNKIHVAINVDNKYIYACLVYLTSLLDNKAESTYYIIHALFGNKFSQDNINKIKTIVKNFGRGGSEIIFHNLRDDFKNAPKNCFQTSNYYRLALPSLLPKINRIIYTDLDSVILKDLTEMYNIKFEKDMYISGILDKVTMLNELEEFGIFTDKYINSGVLLMDLKTMREKSIEKKLRDFIATHEVKIVDQSAINAVCYNNIQILSYKYAIFPDYEEVVQINYQQNPKYKIDESELLKDYHNTTIIHFRGWNKPWNKYFNHKSRAYWWYYAKISGFYHDILKYYSYYGFDNKYVEDLLKKMPEDGGLLKKNYKKYK